MWMAWGFSLALGIVGIVGALKNEEYRIVRMAILGTILSALPFIVLGHCLLR